MLRRLAIIAAALALTGCSADYDLPTGVSYQQVTDGNPTTVPPGLCDDTSVEPDYRLIPLCVDSLPWFSDGTLFRARHGHETVRVSGGGGRGGNRSF